MHMAIHSTLLLITSCSMRWNNIGDGVADLAKAMTCNSSVAEL